MNVHKRILLHHYVVNTLVLAISRSDEEAARSNLRKYCHQHRTTLSGLYVERICERPSRSTLDICTGITTHTER